MFLLLVYSEVENRIAAFRKMLYEKLMVMPSSPDEQKKLIRSVSNFENLHENFPQLLNLQEITHLMAFCRSLNYFWKGQF